MFQSSKNNQPLKQLSQEITGVTVMGRGILCLQFYMHSKIKFSNLKRIFFDTYTLQKASDFFATFPPKTLKLRFLISLHRNKISQRNRREGFFLSFQVFFIFSSKITMPTKHQTMSTQQQITKPIHNKTKAIFHFQNLC